MKRGQCFEHPFNKVQKVKMVISLPHAVIMEAQVQHLNDVIQDVNIKITNTGQLTRVE